MLKTHWRTVTLLERIADNAAIIAAFVLAYSGRDLLLHVSGEILNPLARELNSLAPVEQYFVVLGFSLPLFNAFLSMLGAYRSMRRAALFQLAQQSLFASALVFLSLGALLYAVKLDLSRSFVGLFCFLSGTLIFIERLAALMVLRFFRERGKNFRNLLIVGTGDLARKLYQEIVSAPELGTKVVGFVSPLPQLKLQVHGPNSSAVYDLPARVIADPTTFETTLKRHAVDEVLFTDITQYFDTVEELAQIASEEGVEVSLAADLFSLQLSRSETRYFGSIPLIHYRRTPEGSPALFVKRLMDIIISAVLLLLLSPLFLLCALLVKRSGPGPILFKQKRVGLNGRHFTLLKFRSMVIDAEKLLPQLLDRNEMSGPVFKLRNDPRVTEIGKFLRKYSLDELPQLWNVLRGDMSLVGPRPPIPEEVAKYRRADRRRLSMRPGITCVWQVSGRNNIPDFEEWAKLDLNYIDNWSLELDIELLLRTIPVVFSGRGAQ